MEMEKSVSPFKMADSMGEAPRYLGRREGWRFKMPSGSKRSRTSGLMRTPKEARMPRASGCACLRRLTVSRSSLVLAWKRRFVAGFRTSRAKSARGPLPKKMMSGLFIFAPKLFVAFDFG